jgi:hypothetical protein
VLRHRPLFLTPLALGLLASAAFAADPCEGPGPASPASPASDAAGAAPQEVERQGGWTNLVPANGTGQTFTATRPRITGIEVDLVTGNANPGAGDTLTLTVSTFRGDRLAEVAQAVASGHQGWLCFALPHGGIEVTPGETLVMRLRDTGKVIFGWRYGNDTYPRGHALMVNRARREFDFAFRVHDAAAEPAQ